MNDLLSLSPIQKSIFDFIIHNFKEDETETTQPEIARRQYPDIFKTHYERAYSYVADPLTKLINLKLIQQTGSRPKAYKPTKYSSKLLDSLKEVTPPGGVDHKILEAVEPNIKIVESYLRTKKTEVNRLVRAYPERDTLEIDLCDVDKFNPKLVDWLLQNPGESIKIFEDAFRERVHEEFADNLSISFINPPDHITEKIPREQGAKDIGQFNNLSGIISEVRGGSQLATSIQYECPACMELEGIFWQDQDSEFHTEPYA